MMLSTSYKGRKIIGALDPDTDLFEALLNICKTQKINAGSIQISGALKDAALLEPIFQNQIKSNIKRNFQACQFTHLQGTVARIENEPGIELRGIIAKADYHGKTNFFSGQLIAGKVLYLEFIIEAWDDVVLCRKKDNFKIDSISPAIESFAEISMSSTQKMDIPPCSDPEEPFTESLSQTRISLADENQPAAEDTISKPDGDLWAEVIATSERLGESKIVEEKVEEEEEEEEEFTLHRGDFLLHPKFGKCTIRSVEEDEDKVSVVLDNGRSILLGLDIFRIEFSKLENGRQVFRLSLKEKKIAV